MSAKRKSNLRDSINSSRMQLRSSCDGSCQLQNSKLSKGGFYSSSTPKPGHTHSHSHHHHSHSHSHSHNHQQHHFHHHQQQQNLQVQQRNVHNHERTLNKSKVVVNRLAVSSSRNQHAANQVDGVNREEAISSEIIDNERNQMMVNSSSVNETSSSRVLPSGGLEVQNNLNKTVSAEKQAESAASRSAYLKNKREDYQYSSTKYKLSSVVSSDYSSAEDSDDNSKTGYTYGESISYKSSSSISSCSPPNMSRRRLRSTGNVYSAAIEGDHHLRNQYGNEYMEVANDASAMQLLYQQQRRTQVSENEITEDIYGKTSVSPNGNAPMLNGRISMRSNLYGLDYDTDTEGTYRMPNGLHKKSSSNAIQYFFSRHVSWFFFSVFYLVYSTVVRTLLFDTWILSSLTQKLKNSAANRNWWLLIPFLLLLLLPLLWLWLPYSDGKNNNLYNSETVPSSVETASDILTPFHILYQILSPLSGAAYSLWPFAYFFTSNHTLNTATKAETIISINNYAVDVDIEALVKSKVQEEVALKLKDFKVSSHNSDASVAGLRVQLDSIKKLTEELKVELGGVEGKLNILETSNGGLKSNFASLKAALDAVQGNIRNLEIAQQKGFASVYNCCKNHTEYELMIQKHIDMFFDKIQNDGTSGDFYKWLALHFASKENVKINNDILRESWGKTILDAIQKAELSIQGKVEEAVKASLVNIDVKDLNISDKFSETMLMGLIQRALKIYDADKTGKADYALESAGGNVVSTRCSETFSAKSAQISILGFPLWFLTVSPRTAIQPSVNPGECWAFKGSEGYLVIQLARTVRPTSFTLEHIPRSLSLTDAIDSAPKDFSVWGLTSLEDAGILLGKYTYDDYGDAMQNFPVQELNVDMYPMVELKIHSNHGNEEFTCLYRFRVHGKLA